MICPKCGNELSLFADKCLCCGMSFKNMTLAQKQKLQKKSTPRREISNSIRKDFKPSDHSKEPKKTNTRIEYNNGYAVQEGMSIHGTRLKKGSFKKRKNNEGIGFRFPHYGLGETLGNY